VDPCRTPPQGPPELPGKKSSPEGEGASAIRKKKKKKYTLIIVAGRKEI